MTRLLVATLGFIFAVLPAARRQWASGIAAGLLGVCAVAWWLDPGVGGWLLAEVVNQAGSDARTIADAGIAAMTHATGVRAP